MRRFSAVRLNRSRRMFTWVMLGLMLSWVGGCQAMIKGKMKSKGPLAQDKFSCGEPLPGRIP